MKPSDPQNAVHIGLHTKALVVLTLVIVSIASISGWVYNRLITQYTIDAQVAEAEHLTDLVCLAAAAHLEDPDPAALKMIAEKLLGHPKLSYVGIIDIRGKELAAVSRIRSSTPTLPPPGLRFAVEISGTQLLDGAVLVSRPVVKGEPRAILGGVRLGMDVQDSLSRLHRANITMLIFGCAFVLVTIPLAEVLVGRLLVRPTRWLARATRRLAQGDLSVRVPCDRTDEIGLLARSFNEMAERIQAQHVQLKQSNERLEVEVARRTAELHLVNQRLRTQIEDNEEFVRAVSHDLNAPLRNIAGLVTMLTMKWGGELPDAVVSRLQRIRANAESETELISELLELSRIRSCPQRRTPVDTGKLFEQIRSSLEFELKTKDITLSVQDGLPTLMAERNRLRQVFMNLIDNAVKYMPARPDASIAVTYKLAGEEHIFLVTDNGPGIDPEDQRKIFTVFRRGGGHNGVPGKGVGLTTVRTIVQGYDGRIWVTSELGKGATFHVALPVAATQVSGEALDTCEGEGSNSPAASAAPVESATQNPAAAPQELPLEAAMDV